MGPRDYVHKFGLDCKRLVMDDCDSDLDRAIRTALRSLEAAQGDISADLAIQHIVGTIQQLVFVVNRLKEEMAKLKT